VNQPESIVPTFDAADIRRDFPILAEKINGHPLVYLDNAATTQKPEAVIEAIADYYRYDNANVHRGVHTLSDRATRKFEAAREKVAAFLGVADSREVIWTRGTTEAINLVAYSWAREQLRPGDRILVPWLEHHSDIVPWQLAAAATGAEVVPVPVTDRGEIDLDAFDDLLDNRVRLVALNHVSNALGTVNPVPVTDRGEIDLDAFDDLLDNRVRLVALNHVSNALGTVNPVADIARRAKDAGALVLVDGAQAVGHFPVDVTALGCDFYTFGGHKLFGPTGIGALWGRAELLEAMPPFLAGGEMIERVSFSGTTFNALPFKFEAGTPHIAGAVGLAAAIDYLAGVDRAAAAAHEEMLLAETVARTADIPGLTRVGAPAKSAGIFSFVLEGCHPSDLGMLLDEQGIAVRTGHHCAQPLMDRLAVPGTVRASYSMYNTLEDVEALVAGIRKAQTLFS
jgi:cysteine desulfurase / selenocysteine lyase